jgi:hypothetical protein
MFPIDPKILEDIDDETFRKAYLDNWNGDDAFISRINGMERRLMNMRNPVGGERAPNCDQKQHNV